MNPTTFGGGRLFFALALAGILLAVAPAGSSAQPDAPAGPDSAAVDSAGAPDSGTDTTRTVRSVRDTVTQLPPVQIEGAHLPPAERSSATSMRLRRSDVTRFLPNTTGDALRTVPGVYIAKTGPWASRIFMRGLGGDRVLIQMDGMRLNTVRGHGAQGSSIPVEWLQEVELLPGASSTIYGSDALAGVVNFTTHRRLFSTAPAAVLTLSADAGEPGGLRAQNARAVLMTPHFGAEVRGNLRRVQALHTPLGEVANSGDHGENASARASLAWQGLELDYEHLHLAALDVGLPAFNSSQGSTGTYPLQGREADRLELAAPAALGGKLDARVLAANQTLRTDFTETTVTPRYVRGNYVGSTTNAAADHVRTTSRSIQPTLRFQGPLEIRILGEVRREQVDGPRTTEVVVHDRDGNPVSTQEVAGESMPAAWRDAVAIGAWVADTLLGVRVEGGVRWDALDSHADSSEVSVTSRLDVRDARASGEAGLSRRFGRVVPYGRVGSGFRAPNLEERYYNDDIHGGMRLFGNPDLVPEQSRVAEVGVRLGGEPIGIVSGLRVSAYRTDVDELISFRYVDQLYGVPRFQYVNVRRARIEGIESVLELRHGPWTATLSGSFPRGRDLDRDERLTDVGTARVAADFITAVPGWMLPSGRVGARVLWNDAVTGTGATLARSAYTVVSLEASCVVAGVRGVFAVENVLNQLYREPVSFIDSPGRQYTLALRRDFNLSLSSRGGS